MTPYNVKNKKGQSLVETALILPIILLLLTAIVDFGLLFNNYLTVSNAAREGARKAAVGGSDAQINSTVSNVASTLIPDRLTITITPTGSGRTQGDPVTVTVQYDYSMVTPIIGAILPGPIQLETSTTMRCE